MGYDLSDGITQNEDGDTTDPDDPKQSFGLTRRACAFMEQQVKEGHPFYLQLSYYAVHPTAQAPSPPSRSTGRTARLGDRAVMAAMTEDLDTCVGRVVKKIDELGITNNTYIIYMSDNGGRTRIFKGGKGNINEGGIRVPLIVSGPGVRGGVYCNEPAVHYDILPTVLDLAAPGFALPQASRGEAGRQCSKTAAWARSSTHRPPRVSYGRRGGTSPIGNPQGRPQAPLPLGHPPVPAFRPVHDLAKPTTSPGSSRKRPRRSSRN